MDYMARHYKIHSLIYHYFTILKNIKSLSHIHSPLCSRSKGDFLPREETGACPDGPRQPNYNPSAASRGKKQDSMCVLARVWTFPISWFTLMIITFLRWWCCNF